MTWKGGQEDPKGLGFVGARMGEEIIFQLLEKVIKIFCEKMCQQGKGSKIRVYI